MGIYHVTVTWYIPISRAGTVPKCFKCDCERRFLQLHLKRRERRERERTREERGNKRGEREQERRERTREEMWLCLLVRSKMTYTFFGRALPRCHAATEERWKLQWWANIHRLWTMDMYMTWNLTLQSSPPKLQAHFTDSLIYKPHGLHIASLLRYSIELMLYYI